MYRTDIVLFPLCFLVTKILIYSFQHVVQTVLVSMMFIDMTHMNTHERTKAEIGLNTVSKTDGGQIEERGYSTEVIYSGLRESGTSNRRKQRRQTEYFHILLHQSRIFFDQSRGNCGKDKLRLVQ